MNVGTLERDLRQWDKAAQTGDPKDLATDIARKNRAIIQQRLQRIKEINQYLRVARGQLDLIENSFQLIADQIVTMRSPRELSGQLDGLLDGVDSIRQAAVDTEQFISTLEA